MPIDVLRVFIDLPQRDAEDRDERAWYTASVEFLCSVYRDGDDGRWMGGHGFLHGCGRADLGINPAMFDRVAQNHVPQVCGGSCVA